LNAAFTFSLLVGGLFIHALLMEGALDLEANPEATHPKTTVIWPKGAVATWPPPAHLTDVEVFQLAGVVPQVFQETPFGPRPYFGPLEGLQD